LEFRADKRDPGLPGDSPLICKEDPFTAHPGLSPLSG
jgi:hypothetical protein